MATVVERLLALSVQADAHARVFGALSYTQLGIECEDMAKELRTMAALAMEEAEMRDADEAAAEHQVYMEAMNETNPLGQE